MTRSTIFSPILLAAIFLVWPYSAALPWEIEVVEIGIGDPTNNWPYLVMAERDDPVIRHCIHTVLPTEALHLLSKAAPSKCIQGGKI